MNRGRKTAALLGLLSVAALALAGTGSAAWVGYGWGTVVPAGSATNCYAPVPGVGYSVINGNDAGKVNTFCYDERAEVYQCGRAKWTQFYVHAAGLPYGSSTWEFTGKTTGQTIGSASGGPALAYHACEMGFFN